MELIGKQIAIETILGQPPELHYPSWYAAQIEKLPPAPPEYLAEQAGILVTDTDTISRQAAIDEIKEIYEWHDNVTKERIIEHFKQLPSTQPEPSQVAKDIARILENGQDMRVIAQPERIRGHWIIRETSSGDTEARCSHCGFTTLVDEPGNGLHMVSDLNFCPNCGSYNGGENEI